MERLPVHEGLETAPHDGTVIPLVIDGEKCRIVRGYWNSKACGWVEDGNGRFLRVLHGVTGWLKPPPTAERW